MNQSGEEQVECPLCMEPLEVDDLHFYPCTCGYQICRFCWNRIREGENGLCPACRKAYPENPADFTPLSQEQVAAMKTEKRAREQQRRTKTQESRRQLSSVRVVQKNLVFVVGLPVRLADPEVLKKQEYFGKYGKIHKVVINHSTAYAGSQGPSASAYVTYVSSADALRAIQNVNNVTIDGRVLKGSLGTTKYCANFMRNQPCPKPDCMYLHELGDPKASFTKEEMHQGMHQVYEKKLHNQLLALPAQPPSKDSPPNSTIQSGFIPTTVVCNTSSSINIANPKWQSNTGNGNMNIGMHSNGNGNGSGPLMLSSSSSSSDSSSSREAWPSLSSSPLHTQDSTPSPQPSGGEGAERGEPEGCGASEENGRETASDRAEVGDDRGNGDGADKRNRSQRRGRRDINSAAAGDDRSQDNDSSLESLNERKTEEGRNERPVEGAEERSFGVPEKHDLLDGDDHNLLEDDGSHDLLDDPDASEAPPRFVTAPLRDRALDFAPPGGRSFPDGLRSGPPLAAPLTFGMRERFAEEPVLDFRTLPPFGMRPDRAPPLVSTRPIMEEQESEGGRYAGENSMDKFFTDFSRNQQLKLILAHTTYGRQQTVPVPRPMPSLAFIESQHVDRLSAIRHSQDTGLSQMQNELANDKFTNNTVDDDLDFDPFKETQKALAEMMENEVLLQQNGPKCSDSVNAESSTRRSLHPPPGFTHMNAFGIGVPRPQPQPQPQPNTGFGQGGGAISDWTQMDPAIVSTGCNTFSQHPPTNPQHLQQQLQQQLQRQQMQLQRQMQQQPSPQQQRDLFSRFSRGVSLDASPKSPFDFSDMPPRQMMPPHPRIHQQNGMMPQQQQQAQHSVMNGHPANGSQRFFSFPTPQRKPEVPNWMMPQFNSAEGPFNQQNRNGFYRSDMYNPMDDGLSDGDKFSTVPMLRDPPGFSSVQGQSKAAAGGPECIESK